MSQGSILENRQEVEEVRQELLERLSGSASNRARNMGLKEALQVKEYSDSSEDHSNSTTEVASTMEVSEDFNAAATTAPHPSDSDNGIPSMAEAYGELPRRLLGPMLTFFRVPGVAESGTEKDLYEIASILCLRGAWTRRT